MNSNRKKINLLKKAAERIKDGRILFTCVALEKEGQDNEVLVEELQEFIYFVFSPKGNRRKGIWEMFDRESRLIGIYLLIELLKNPSENRLTKS